jgi:hypothetical protein
MMGIFQDLIQGVTAYIGDKTLMLAAVSAASNVIVADSEVDEEEVETPWWPCVPTRSSRRATIR